MKEWKKPKVVAVIGSSRFQEFHRGAEQRLTLQGRIVLGLGFFHHRDMVPISAVQKEHLDELAARKIDLADEVYVINVNGYVGETTKRLINYAREHGKPIIGAMEPLDAEDK